MLPVQDQNQDDEVKEIQDAFKIATNTIPPEWNGMLFGNAPFCKISNSAQCGTFALIL